MFIKNRNQEINYIQSIIEREYGDTSEFQEINLDYISNNIEKYISLMLNLNQTEDQNNDISKLLYLLLNASFYQDKKEYLEHTLHLIEKQSDNYILSLSKYKNIFTLMVKLFSKYQIDYKHNIKLLFDKSFSNTVQNDLYSFKIKENNNLISIFGDTGEACEIQLLNNKHFKIVYNLPLFDFPSDFLFISEYENYSRRRFVDTDYLDYFHVNTHNLLLKNLKTYYSKIVKIKNHSLSLSTNSFHNIAYFKMEVQIPIQENIIDILLNMKEQINKIHKIKKEYMNSQYQVIMNSRKHYEKIKVNDRELENFEQDGKPLVCRNKNIKQVIDIFNLCLNQELMLLDDFYKKDMWNESDEEYNKKRNIEIILSA